LFLIQGFAHPNRFGQAYNAVFQGGQSLNMPKYVVISNHPPMSCPSASKTLRELNKTLDKDLQPMMQKHKVKPETILHLDPGHKVLWVLEAPSAEAVRDFIYKSGLERWNDFEFFMASSMDETLNWIQGQPTIW
jgi:hypothetical protein